MTKRQIKLAKFILKEHNLSEIQSKFGLDYLELQEYFGENKIFFSDDQMDDATELTLSNEILEAIENENRRLFDVWFTRTLAIIAIAVSVGALTVSIISLKQKKHNGNNHSGYGYSESQM